MINIDIRDIRKFSEMILEWGDYHLRRQRENGYNFKCINDYYGFNNGGIYNSIQSVNFIGKIKSSIIRNID